MNKGTHFSGQPMYGKLINLLDKQRILQISREYGGERYVKHFDAWQHLVVMLFAVIQRFDSLREIVAAMLPQARKFNHLGIHTMPRRSTLSDANVRRSEAIFEAIYRELYSTYKDVLSADSRKNNVEKWMKHLQIIDSTTITLFSNFVFKGAGRNPKSGRKKGGIKVHTCICANEWIPSDIRFTSAATHDAFMLKPSNYHDGDLVAFDRAYIDYTKFEELTQNGVVYVTKMKSNFKYEVIEDVLHISSDGLVLFHEQHVVFTKRSKGKEEIKHHARIISYTVVNKDKTKTNSLLTNDMEMPVDQIKEVYDKRWKIELLFKQIKQNFPLRYFYGESANAIKIQIWVTLIANLLLMLLKSQIKRKWSFSNFATMVRILLMSYIDCYSFFEHPEKDWQLIVEAREGSPPEKSLFD